MSASLIQAREGVAALMRPLGFATAAKSMAAGETYVSDFAMCAKQWAAYADSGCNRFFDAVEGTWFTAPMKLKPRSY